MLRAASMAALLLLPAAAGAAPDPTVELLRELVDADGAPGFEGPVRDILRREWKGLLGSLRTDGIGNLLGSRPGPAGGPRILLMAHMDEVGFLVRHVDEHGFVYMNPVGGWNDQSVLTQRFTIQTPRGPVVGYTGMKSGHISTPEERKTMVALQDMMLDIGVRSREEAERLGVRPGLPVTYRTRFEELNGTGRYLARAFDDRVGLAAITEVLRQVKGAALPCTVEVAATVQEEIGLRGAMTVYPGTRPDLVINLEIGIAADFPLLTSPKLAQEALGKGPALFIFDGSMIPNNRLVEWTVGLARAEKIPLQFSSVTGYGEDGAALQKSGEGVPAINLGVPTRYAHSQSSVIDRADYDALVKLLVKMVQRLDAGQVKAIREF